MNGVCIAATSPVRSPMALLRQTTRLSLTASVAFRRDIRTHSLSVAPMTACGCLWDFRGQTVELPPKKKEKFGRFLDVLEPSARVTKLECARVASALAYSSYVVPGGDGYIKSFQRLMSRYNGIPSPATTALPLPRSLAHDEVQWWRTTLAEPCRTPLMLTPPDDSATIYVDASLWGIGLVVGRNFASFKLKTPWTVGSKRDINWAELLAVEIALLYLASIGTTRRTVTIRTDSVAVQSIFEKGSSLNEEVQEVFRRIQGIRVSKGLWVKPLRVPTGENVANAPSRGQRPGGSIQGRLDLNKFKVPPRLAPFVAMDIADV